MTIAVEDLTAYLKANAGINAIVAGRVWPQNIPQNAVLPGLVYKEISGVRPSTLEGATGLNNGRYEFGCVALDYLAAKQLSQAVRQALSKLRAIIGSTEILDTSLLMERDVYDSLTLEYRVDLDFQIWHREP